jgi:hypothetical protein
MALEVRDRRLGGAALRRHVGAQRGDVRAGFGHAPGAGQRALREQRRGGRVQSELHAGIAQRLGEQEEVRRAGAGDGGHGLEQRLLAHPAGPAHGGEHALGALARARIGPRRRIQAGDAAAQQRRRVRHAAHDRRLAAEPAPEGPDADAGGDGHDGGRGRRRQSRHGLAHHLRLDREHEHVSAGEDLGRVCARLDAEVAAQHLRARGVRLGHPQLRGRMAGRAQAADQAARHLAATDEGDHIRCHRSPFGIGVDRESDRR